MGDRIKILRQAKGWTQEVLANHLGVTKAAVQQWENGSTQNIKNITFYNLVRELGTTHAYLLFGPDQDTTPRYRRRPAG